VLPDAVRRAGEARLPPELLQLRKDYVDGAGAEAAEGEDVGGLPMRASSALVTAPTETAVLAFLRGFFGCTARVAFFALRSSARSCFCRSFSAARSSFLARRFAVRSSSWRCFAASYSDARLLEQLHFDRHDSSCRGRGACSPSSARGPSPATSASGACSRSESLRSSPGPCPDSRRRPSRRR
jgi:hypothetical protein